MVVFGSILETLRNNKDKIKGTDFQTMLVDIEALFKNECLNTEELLAQLTDEDILQDAIRGSSGGGQITSIEQVTPEKVIETLSETARLTVFGNNVRVLSGDEWISFNRGTFEPSVAVILEALGKSTEEEVVNPAFDTTPFSGSYISCFKEALCQIKVGYGQTEDDKEENIFRGDSAQSGPLLVTVVADNNTERGESPVDIKFIVSALTMIPLTWSKLQIAAIDAGTNEILKVGHFVPYQQEPLFTGMDRTRNYRFEVVEGDIAVQVPLDATGDAAPADEDGPGAFSAHSYADEFYEFVLQIGRGEGPGSAEKEEKELGTILTQAIYQSVNTLHASKIKIYTSQVYGGFTQDAQRALRQIKQRTRGVLTCSMFSGKDNLRGMLEQDKRREESGEDTEVKRFILVEEGIARDIDELLEENPGLFEGTRLLNFVPRKDYSKIPERKRTIHQLEMITISILARLLENGTSSEQFIKQVLREMLIGRMSGFEVKEIDKFLDTLGTPDKEVTDIKIQIRYFLNRAVSLVKLLDHNMRIMRVLWTYA